MSRLAALASRAATRSSSSSEFRYTVSAVIAAACYVGATFVMKYWDRLGWWKAGLPIAGLFVGAVAFETLALRTNRFGLILLLILGAECAIGAVISLLWFREAFTLREAIGFAVIVVGIALVEL